MIKVIKAEIKKTVSKPGIYVLAIFLAVILVLGVFVYKPKTTTYSTLPNFNDVSAWTGDGQFKSTADRLVSNATNAVSSYIYNGEANDPNNGKYYQHIMYGEDGKSGYWLEYQTTCKEMEVRKNQTTVNAFLEVVNKINNLITKSQNPNNNLAHLSLTSSSNYSNYLTLYKSICVNTGDDGIFNRPEESLNLESKIKKYSDNYKAQFETSIKSFIFPTLNEVIIKDYTENSEGTKIFVVNERLNKINEEMLKLETEGLTKSNMEKYHALAQKYTDTCTVYNNLVKYQLLSNAYTFVNTKEKINLQGLENESEYNTNTQLIKYKYLFEQDKTERDFANPFAIGNTITNQTTAFDYTFFILKLFSFIIIAYAVMSACGTIAGEIKDGSMRYYAIRPIKRSSILFGKFFAIIIMSTIMILFSTIIAMCVGAGVYGWTNLQILTIFNGTTAMVINPIMLLLCFVLSFILELTIYTSIAFLLTNLLKSDLLAATIMLLIYLINTILPVFAGGMNSWLAFYPFSHINLFALFGSSIIETGTDMLSSLLRINVYANTNLILTIVVSALFVIIPISIASHLFKKKDL